MRKGNEGKSQEKRRKGKEKRRKGEERRGKTAAEGRWLLQLTLLLSCSGTLAPPTIVLLLIGKAVAL